jgi:hypothetical protein
VDARKPHRAVDRRRAGASPQLFFSPCDWADSDLQGAFWAVIERVPEEVQRFIKERCLFLSVNPLCVFDAKGWDDKRYLLILDERIPKEQQVDAVAATVARAWSRCRLFDEQPGHEERKSPSFRGEPYRTSWNLRFEEPAAAAALQEWGFTESRFLLRARQ